jgi:hypothetical protein
MSKLHLTYKDPLVAIFMRRLAWETLVAKPNPPLAAEYVQTQILHEARMDLGFQTSYGGARNEFLDSLRSFHPPLITKKRTPPETNEPKWKGEDAWRLLRLPSHFFVRQLSENPTITVPKEFIERKNPHFQELTVTLRNPALPQLRVFLGSKKPKGNPFGQRRGIYILRLPTKLYIGKSDEFDVRLGGHLNGANRKTNRWIFISSEKSDKTFTLDALAAAEALAICNYSGRN